MGRAPSPRRGMVERHDPGAGAARLVENRPRPRRPASPVLPYPKDAARFRLLPHFGGIEVMDAAFIHHNFTPHTHDELMIGVLRSGRKRFRCGRGTFVAAPGALSVVNPGEVHTGTRQDGKQLLYTAIYVPPGVLERAGAPASADVGQAVAEDGVVWHGLSAAVDADVDRLAGEEALLTALAALTRRYGGGARMAAPRSCRPAVRRVQDYMQAHLESALHLDRLAEVAGIGQRHLIRSFRADAGLTPHAYLTRLRVERAKALLRRHAPAAHVAAATGFADQAHLTKAFKRLTGATPARYAAGVIHSGS